MSKSNKIFEDLSQLAGSAAGLMNDLQGQMREDIKTRVEELAARLDLVPRDEFERVEAQVKELQDRLSKLENKK